MEFGDWNLICWFSIPRVLQKPFASESRLEASSGPEALASAAHQRPDLVILDLMMPGMDGFSVLEALRKQRETANIPVIVVTAKELTPQERRRLEGRISRLMTKGEFLSEDLLGEIGRALD